LAKSRKKTGLKIKKKPAGKKASKATKKSSKSGKAVLKKKNIKTTAAKSGLKLKKKSTTKEIIKSKKHDVKKHDVKKHDVKKAKEHKHKISEKEANTEESIRKIKDQIKKAQMELEKNGLKQPVKKLKKYKPNKKVKYTLKELKHFRDIILRERKAILESAKANMEALVDNESGEYKGDNLTYSTHMAEQGTDEMEREKNYMFVQRDEKYLGYLQDALMRIDQGTYGICIDCKDEPKNLCKTCPLIQKERLELVPITQHCIECKNLRG